MTNPHIQPSPTPERVIKYIARNGHADCSECSEPAAIWHGFEGCEDFACFEHAELRNTDEPWGYV